MEKIEGFDENELVLLKVKTLLKQGVNGYSFKKWINDLEIESIDDDKIVLIAHSDEQKEVIGKRMYDLFFHTFGYVTKKDRDIDFVLRR
jgi:hypothetical protein